MSLLNAWGAIISKNEGEEVFDASNRDHIVKRHKNNKKELIEKRDVVLDLLYRIGEKELNFVYIFENYKDKITKIQGVPAIDFNTIRQIPKGADLFLSKVLGKEIEIFGKGVFEKEEKGFLEGIASLIKSEDNSLSENVEEAYSQMLAAEEKIKIILNNLFEIQETLLPFESKLDSLKASFLNDLVDLEKLFEFDMFVWENYTDKVKENLQESIDRFNSTVKLLDLPLLIDVDGFKKVNYILI